MSNMESTRIGFGKGIMNYAKKHPEIIVTSADTYRSFALNDYVKRYPEQYYEFGIAEQNMITASAAMASEGYNVFTVGYSPFLSMRALEQIRTFVAYPNLKVNIVAGLGGLSGDSDGVTHQGTEDIGIVRTIPNINILCPADAVAAEAFVEIAAKIDGPVYLRLGRGKTPVIYKEDQKFEFGKAIYAKNYGYDAVIFSAGPCVAEAIKAAEMLNSTGINVTVIDMHTIKPIDEEIIGDVCSKTKCVLTVEDGSIYGCLGGAVAEVLMENSIRVEKFKRLGLKTFGTAGELLELLEYFGLDSNGIVKETENIVNKK